MPAGKYWVGDLCYVLDHEWDEVCDKMFSTPDGSGEFQLNDGRKFAVYGTKWGDGSYEDNYGRIYHVDAGSIGIISAKDIGYHNMKEGPVSGGNLVDFPEPFATYGGRKNGKIVFGPVTIETDYVEED
jgi:hypothetical protein